MQTKNCCCGGSIVQGPSLPDTIIYTSVVGEVGPTGPIGPTGPTGAAGPAGGAQTIDASTNRNDNPQTVQENGVVSISGSNILSCDATDMIFVNNTVRLESAGLFGITATIELTGDAKTYDLAIRVNQTDYDFVGIINTGANKGTVSHTIYINLATAPTTVAIYNKTSGTINISRAELDVVRIV